MLLLKRPVFGQRETQELQLFSWHSYVYNVCIIYWSIQTPLTLVQRIGLHEWLRFTPAAIRGIRIRHEYMQGKIREVRA